MIFFVISVILHDSAWKPCSQDTRGDGHQIFVKDSTLFKSVIQFKYRVHDKEVSKYHFFLQVIFIDPCFYSLKIYSFPLEIPVHIFPQAGCHSLKNIFKGASSHQINSVHLEVQVNKTNTYNLYHMHPYLYKCLIMGRGWDFNDIQVHVAG